MTRKPGKGYIWYVKKKVTKPKGNDKLRFKKSTYKNSNIVVKGGQKTWIKFTNKYKNGQIKWENHNKRNEKNVQHNSLLGILKLKQKMF